MGSRALELSKSVMKPICRPSIVCKQNKEYFAHLCTSFLKMFVDSAVMIQYKYLNFVIIMHSQTLEKYKYYYVEVSQHFWL